MRESMLGAPLVVDGRVDRRVGIQLAHLQEDALRAAEVDQEVVDEGYAARAKHDGEPHLRHPVAALLPTESMTFRPTARALSSGRGWALPPVARADGAGDQQYENPLPA